MLGRWPDLVDEEGGYHSRAYTGLWLFLRNAAGGSPAILAISALANQYARECIPELLLSCGLKMSWKD